MSTKKLIASAQGSDAHSNVFFRDDMSGNIRVYISQEEGEVEAAEAKNYSQDFIVVDGTRIKVTSPDMGALAWQSQNDGVSHTRLYYADANNTLQELCLDSGNANWFRGSLGSTVTVQCMQDTPIDVHINYAYNQLKVYSYGPDNTTTPTVTWTTLNLTNWQTKLISR
ncbi:uncharacterized protein Z520_00645 [Fonsecaea multimorphosa CBS 102226]|uniref:Fucose-specific lectin n=1 Tax=Fonsecaea multimorphosa CBS 102226 TaxID=1442371 RepID=A0A0D2KCV9_9EURO|nr:uncharacterized protein Z520_00645 [Fonsecaea multimorphosa CBS 102226]KIY03953.1 hypothetical protein Z520_00645 [Fonsecaea multimorphosa CBS 102226]OAL31793.1 hypothetical protein AYO22_00663 [Fonsecaea multimorphosa]